MANHMKSDGITGSRSVWSQMDQKLRKKIDREIIVGEISQEEIAAKYGLSRPTIARRKARLLEAAAELVATGKEGRREKIKSQAREVMGWTEEKIKETYELAKQNKQVLLTKDGPVMREKKDRDGVPIYDISGKVELEPWEVEAPLLPAMIGALKEARELARLHGEVEGVVGRVRELREQALLQSGQPGLVMGPGGMLGPGSTVQTMNVLVMPKDPEVEIEERRRLEAARERLIDQQMEAEEVEFDLADEVGEGDEAESAD
jgi:hypothetical protein